METTKEFPEWEEVAEQLRLGLGYSDITIERTRYTYRVFTQDYCFFVEGNTPEVVLKDGIERVNKDPEPGTDVIIIGCIQHSTGKGSKGTRRFPERRSYGHPSKTAG